MKAVAASNDGSGGSGAPALMSCQGISKHYGPVYALQSASFELRGGEVHALLGQNGAGKSTLIKILAGAERRDSGQIQLTGNEVDFKSPADSQKSGISVVYQDLSLVPAMSVAANLYLGREDHNAASLVRHRAQRRAAEQLLTELDFPLNPRDLVSDLPFAYRQLTEIAKALSSDVRVLVLDEPTSSLSGPESDVFFAAVKRVVARGVGVVFVTHRLNEVLEISDRVTVLRDGTNVATFYTKDTSLPSLVNAIVGRSSGELAQAEGGDFDAAIMSPTQPKLAELANGPVRLQLSDVHNERLSGVDLNVRQGEIVGLAGLMGSGRTEILQTVFGLRRVKSGTMTVNGAPAHFRGPYEAIRRGVALAPEDRHGEALVLDHTIEQNLAMSRLPQLGRGGVFRKRRSLKFSRNAIKALSVKAPSPTSRVGNLSGGNQQKVVFAKWKTPTPSLLLLDEPTVGVDVGAREEIYEVVRQSARDGAGVIVASSEFVELLLLCHRIAVIADGRIVKQVHRDEVRSEEHLHQLVQECQS